MATEGETILFNNRGAYKFYVMSVGFEYIAGVDSGAAVQLYLSDNSTANGTWRVIAYGASTSTANAADLAGYGLKAIASSLNQDVLVTSTSTVGYSLGASNRASLVKWTGTGYGEIVLPSASTVQNGWMLLIRNSGGGELELRRQGTDLIDGTTTKVYGIGESSFVVCDGSAFHTVGFGRSLVSTFDYIAIDVAGLGAYTLSSAEQNRIAYKLTGILTGNRTIIVPATTQQYWVNNATTGNFTLTVKTLLAEGHDVAQQSKSILYCDGYTVTNADNALAPSLVSGGVF
jgi:hypothetical protein